MLSYLNEISDGVREGRLDDALVHRSAKSAAWACVRTTYSPGRPTLSEMIEFLGGKDEGAYEMLAYLRDRMRLIEPAGESRDRFKFSLATPQMPQIGSKSRKSVCW